MFDGDGKFLTEWKQFGRPSSVFIDKNDVIYVADSQSTEKTNPGFKMGIRIGSAKDGKVTGFIPETARARRAGIDLGRRAGHHLRRLHEQDGTEALREEVTAAASSAPPVGMNEMGDRLQPSGRVLALVVGALTSQAMGAPCAHAQTPTGYYAGKTVKMIIGLGVGGGYDLWGRILARHLGRHLPGNPNVIAQNMEGAGSFRAANYFQSVARARWHCDRSPGARRGTRPHHRRARRTV